MLSCHVIQNPDQKHEVLKKLMKEKSVWVVSDLQTKFWMQTQLRRYHGSIICGDDVLRASELWQQSLFRKDPYWKILNPYLAQFFIEKWMAVGVKELDLKLSGKDRKKAYQTIGQILPLLSHLEGEEVMAEWFLENQDAKERWEDWFQICSYLWRQFLDKKTIPSDWIKGVLVNQEFSSHHPRLVFDLGLDIDDVEAELILNLSRTCDVEVIIPGQEDLLEPYEMLRGRCQPKEYEKTTFMSTREFKKLPSMLAEIKQATAYVRDWADQGINLERIAIVSPAIENYWPTLSEYLLVEGIPVNKNIVAPLSQFDIYQTWLSSLRFALLKVKNFDGTQLFFAEKEDIEIEYSDYKRLFKNLYSVDDFKRNEEVSKRLPAPIDLNKSMDFAEFIDWAESLFAKNREQQWDELLHNFDDFFLLNEKLQVEQWIDFFANFFARKEKTVELGDEKGIHILSPKAALNMPFDKIILMGLSEQNLSDGYDTALQWADIESIKLQFGFSLPHADRFDSLHAIEWLEKKKIDELLCLHSETDFSGRFQAPSFYWLQNAVDLDQNLELQAPRLSRWDQAAIAKTSDPQREAYFSKEQTLKTLEFIKKDLGEGDSEEVFLPKLSLSASSFEEYFKCPFRFFAAKGLKLSDLPSLDLDIDYQTRGQLIHKICETIVNKKMWLSSEVELIKMIDQAKDSIEMEVYDQKFWQFVRPFYLRLSKDFISFESQWREKYPQTQTVYTEKFIETRLASPGEEKLFSLSESGVPFRGVIDRIDQSTEGNYAIIDYKSSGNSLTQYKSWLKKGNLQLSLYSLALTEGVLNGQAENVVGAFYFAMNDMDRGKGFSVDSASPEFLPKKKTSEDEKEQLLTDTKILAKNLFVRIQSGDMGPQPEDFKTCEKCQWKTICRYPNLNL